jgi:beta-glucoside operon transcriptional antiterminator
MVVETILNNNAILVKSIENVEAIVRSKGIGFKYKKGDELDFLDIEKIYYLEDELEKNNYQILLDNFPSEYLDVSEKILSYASTRLSINFPLSATIALTDHLAFAIERAKDKIVVQNMMSLLVEQLHPKEFQIGKYGIHLVSVELGIILPEEEAGNIALHLLNYSTENKNITEMMASTKAIKDIVNIVRFSFIEPIDEDRLNYSRFLTHLQFFIQRIVTGTYFGDNVEEIYSQISRKYETAFHCAQRIKDYVSSTFSIEIGQEEVVYLTVHINRLIARNVHC